MYDGIPFPSEEPSLFQDIRITSTETAKEVGGIGSTTYTLYVLEVHVCYKTFTLLSRDCLISHLALDSPKPIKVKLPANIQV